MRTMAKDPIIFGSGTKVPRQDEIIKGAEKLVDFLFSGNIDDQVDGMSQPAELSTRKITPTNDPSSRSFAQGSSAQFQQKCGRADVRFGGSRAPLAEPESSRVTPLSSPTTEEPDHLLLSSELVDYDREPDEVDGIPSDLPYNDKPEEEKEEILAEIAEKLKTIGDSYATKVGCASPSMSTLLDVSLRPDVVEKLASNLTYENFENAISRTLGDELGLQHLVFAYRLSSALARKVGNSERSSDASRCCLSYITSNLVGWVAENGGWRGVLALL